MGDPLIIDGAEPFSFEGSTIGVLLIHGFTGTTQSMRYLGTKLHEAGFSVVGPRLAGHGISPAAMSRSSATEWVRSAEEGLGELRAKCTAIFVAGLSMGGTLSLNLAATHPDVVKGVVPINAAVQVNSHDLGRLAFGRDLPQTVPGIGSDIKDPDSRELAYPEVPVASFKELFGLVAATRALLPCIKCPTLVIQSREDHVVLPANAHIITSGVGSDRVELLWLNDSYHVATIDNDKDLIAAEIVRFIKRQSG